MIFIPELNAKFLIDTGSGKSFINPSLAYHFYPEYIYNENFTVKTAHAISYHNEVLVIPIFPCFNIDGCHKFFIFDFSEKYDGLLGIEFLKQIYANLDICNSILRTPYADITLFYNQFKNDTCENKNKNQFKPYTFSVPARTTQKIKLPVKQKNGTAIFNYIQFSDGVEIPESLITISNFSTYVMLTNAREKDINITINKPFDTEPILENEVNFIEKMETNTELDFHIDTLRKQNLKNLRLKHCNKEEYLKIRNLCYQYRDIFHCDGIPLSFTNQIKHEIKLTDESPIYTKSYRYPEIHKTEVKTQVNKMLNDGIIQHSNSPWSSPIWIVPKKLDASKKRKWRIVIDFRKLNLKTVDDKFPLPNITDILDKLGRAKYFSTLDLANGFHQIEMKNEDIPKTAFSTDTGHYEFKRLPFGLKNAPATFQRVMNNILRGLQNEICAVYLDDIIIFSTSLEEHIQRLKTIFERLRNANFKVQLDKSEFLHKEVDYLGHKITQNGVKPNPDKINSVKHFPIPNTQKDIKSFLGLAGYYRRFIKNFAKISKPLTHCLKKGNKVDHTPQFIDAFNHLKNLLINAPILKYPDFTKEFILTTDASNIALGAVLSQGNPPNDNPIAYASRTLNETEQKYSTIEKELLAIVWACKYFRPYLYGKKFKIYTDHRPLVWLFNLKEPNSKLMRWRLKLEEYDYTIIYKSGKQNTNADALSRIQLNAIETESILNNPGDITEDIDQFLERDFNPQDLCDFDIFDTLEDIETLIPKHKIENTEKPKPKIENIENPKPKIIILQDIQLRPPNKKVIEKKSINTIHSANENETQTNMKLLDEIINNKTDQFLIKKSPYIPYQKTEYQKFDDHRIIHATLPNDLNIIVNFLKTYLKNKNTYIYFFSKELRPIFHKAMTDHFNHFNLIECSKLVNNVEPDERKRIIQYSHEGKTNHRGIEETTKRIKTNYYWKQMKTDITNYINDCEICHRAKYNRKPPNEPLILTNTPSKPFEIIHIDTFKISNQKYLTIIDKFSKYAQSLPYLGTAISACEQLLNFFSFMGIPKQIVADNGTEFKNETLKDLLKVHKINIHFTTPYHHESNAPIERLHSTLLEHIRLLKEQDKNSDINTLMRYAIIAYNSTIHSQTNFTPFELTLGHTDSRDPMLIIPTQVYSDYIYTHKTNTQTLYDKIKETTLNKKQKQIDYHNKDKKTNEVKIGTTIYKKNDNRDAKIKNKFLGPYTVSKILENGKLEILNTKNNKTEIIHKNETKITKNISDVSQPSCSSSKEKTQI